MSQASESESDDTSIHSDPFFALSSVVCGNDGTTEKKNIMYNISFEHQTGSELYEKV